MMRRTTTNRGSRTGLKRTSRTMLEEALAKPRPFLFPEIQRSIKRIDGETDQETYFRVARELRYLGVGDWESWAHKAGHGSNSSHTIRFQDEYRRWISLIQDLEKSEASMKVFARYEEQGGNTGLLFNALWSLRNREDMPMRGVQSRTSNATIRRSKEALQAALDLRLESRPLREALHSALVGLRSFPESTSEYTDRLNGPKKRSGRPAGLNRNNFTLGIIALEFRSRFGDSCYKDILTLLLLADPAYAKKTEEKYQDEKGHSPQETRATLRKRLAFVNRRHIRELRDWHKIFFIDPAQEKNPA